VIVNQRGDGIMLGYLLGYYVIGSNWVYNNLVINAGLGPEWPDGVSYHRGIRINTGHENVAETSVYIYNNTLYGNGWAGAAIPEESGSLLFDPWVLSHGTLYFSNNIIYSTGEPYLAGESGNLPQDDYRNCWFGDGNGLTWDTTAIHVDPGFVASAQFNFQLLKNSPCIDTGKDVSSIVCRDLWGRVRPQGTAFDIGAFELAGPPPELNGFIFMPLIFTRASNQDVGLPGESHIQDVKALVKREWLVESSE
jgi:hypothetical protein